MCLAFNDRVACSALIYPEKEKCELRKAVVVNSTAAAGPNCLLVERIISRVPSFEGTEDKLVTLAAVKVGYSPRPTYGNFKFRTEPGGVFKNAHDFGLGWVDCDLWLMQIGVVYCDETLLELIILC